MPQSRDGAGYHDGQEGATGGTSGEEDCTDDDDDFLSVDGDEEDIAAPARAGAYRWYMQHLYKPLYPGAIVTAIQACFVFMCLFNDANMGSNVIDKLLRLIWRILPRGNFLPPSFYMMKRILGIDSYVDYEYHACPCHKHRYEKISRADWAAHHGDACPKCGKTRFMRDKGGRMIPRLVSSTS